MENRIQVKKSLLMFSVITIALVIGFLTFQTGRVDADTTSENSYQLSAELFDADFQTDTLMGAEFGLSETPDFSNQIILTSNQKGLLTDHTGQKTELLADKTYYLRENYAPIGFENLLYLYQIKIAQDGKAQVSLVKSDGTSLEKVPENIDLGSVTADKQLTLNLLNTAPYRVNLAGALKSEFTIRSYTRPAPETLDAKKLALSDAAFNKKATYTPRKLARGTVYLLTPKDQTLADYSIALYKNEAQQIEVKKAILVNGSWHFERYDDSLIESNIDTQTTEAIIILETVMKTPILLKTTMVSLSKSSIVVIILAIMSGAGIVYLWKIGNQVNQTK
ncbi:SpaA isopeptide-forming pilin-related protein [Lactococcus insecticola]|uniref:SpaA-like prealbumin fold domain-containing protein n=1 Tax=Pseudolactococcus insecticola TaxID=2709158 RepID=A0A6A0B6L9_9LACT|nr:hypothetical protein [Lactococcus insecticola]GFH40912.1 hypothetical protein Hs20B_13100 [Lactococcus insecticola]